MNAKQDEEIVIDDSFMYSNLNRIFEEEDAKRELSEIMDGINEAKKIMIDAVSNKSIGEQSISKMVWWLDVFGN